MKSILLFSIIFLTNLSISNGQANAGAGATTMTTKFKVLGNCGMCEKRIETAAKIDGVSVADWDVDSKILTITFDPAKVKPTQVHKAVAAVGHDTEKVKATTEVYENLHGCCQYERGN